MDCLSKEDRRLTRLAERIAEDLFTCGGTNTRACRLVMAFYKPGADRMNVKNEFQTGTGWCQVAVVDAILKHLRRANRKSNNRKS